MTNISTKRQSWVDFARGIAIILALYRHVFEGLKNTGIYIGKYIALEHFNIMFFSFRMPLFFIVSGIFLSASFSKRGLSRYIEVKARTILYPYFLWGVLQISLQVIFSKYTNSDRTVSDYLNLFYQPRKIDQFWYLMALFNVSVLYVIIKYVVKFKTWQQLALGIVLFFLASYFHQHNIDLGFLTDIFSFYIFILLGDLINKVMRSENNIKLFQSWRVSASLLIPFLVAQGYFLVTNLNHPEVSGYRYVEYYQPLLFFLIAVVGCAFIISICFLLQRFNRPNWLRVLGKHSLYIYVAHVIAFASVRALMINIFHITNIPILFITGIIFGLLIPVLLYRISEKLNIEWVFALKERELPKRSEPSATIANASVMN